MRYIHPLECLWILDNLPIDEEKAGGNRNVVLQKDAENSRDGEQPGCIKENDNKKYIYTQNQKED